MKVTYRFWSIFFMGCLGLLAGCSQFRRTPTSLAWHNLNARFNAHLIARDNLNYAHQILQDTVQEDYANLLLLQWPLDSNFTRPIHKHADVAIKMTSLIAERHANSKFLYPAYLMLGEARLLRGNLEDAEEVYKFINSESQAEKYHTKALLGLLKSYLNRKDAEGIQSVIQVLKTKNLSNEEKQEFLFLNAYYHQLTEEWALSVAFLDESIQLQKKSFQKGRNLYIAGQMYELLGRTDLARQRFQSVLKQPVPYPMRFQSEINATLYTRGGNIQSNLERLSKSGKNEKIQDQIAYKMGEMAENAGEWEKAIAHYKKSIQLSPSNSSQRGKSYLAVADLLYDEFQSYELAKVYYDSALNTLPSSNASYALAQSKSKSLQEFVRHWQVIQLEDSLQRLATYPPEKLRETALKSLQSPLKLSVNSTPPVAKATGQRWALVDPLQLARDKVSFVGIWGSRPLEDHWRRKDKEVGSIGFQVVRETGGKKTDTTQAASNQNSALENRLAEWEKVIPRTLPQRLASQLKKENAYFQIGKIYKLQFNEPQNAQQIFKKMLEDFPNSIHEPEVLYFLALLDGQAENPYQRLLIDRYPQSVFSKQLASGAVAVTADLEERATKAYQNLVTLYEQENYSQGATTAEQDYYQFIGTKWQDKIAYLRILFLSKGNQIEPYQMALQEFIANHPSSTFIKDVQDRYKLLKP
ncbi:MAG: tetratricopeptide repeat protein [Spirosomataceae bacterium]